VRGRARLLAKTLATLEHELLDPATFVRVHRSAIVNTSRIASAEPHFHGELTLVLHDGTRVPCSRRHRRALEEKLYFTT
jgi:DNA-binding LytR/AlgR family response regulator